MNETSKDVKEYMVLGTSAEPQFQFSACESNVPTSINAIESNDPLGAPDYKWSVNNTKMLIDCYAKCRKKVGTFDIKNIKMMWQRIAEELSKFNINATADNCQNRWRVLERNYKKCVDTQNKSGRRRKFFEFQAEMEEIFGKIYNTPPRVHPPFILPNIAVETVLEEAPEKVVPKEVCKGREDNNNIKLMEKIRLDRKFYYNARLEIERQKLEEIKKRNKLIEDRNEIIRQKNCNCQCNSVIN